MRVEQPPEKIPLPKESATPTLCTQSVHLPPTSITRTPVGVRSLHQLHHTQQENHKTTGGLRNPWSSWKVFPVKSSRTVDWVALLQWASTEIPQCILLPLLSKADSSRRSSVVAAQHLVYVWLFLGNMLFSLPSDLLTSLGETHLKALMKLFRKLSLRKAYSTGLSMLLAKVSTVKPLKRIICQIFSDSFSCRRKVM